MPDKKFELGDYVEVKDRIKLFYELFGQGRLVTGDVRLTSEPDGVPRVMVQALAYRTPDDEHPGVGWSWLELPGKTPYTRGSEIENAETSAWGRAIGSLGILIDRSIASANEVQNKRTDDAPPAPEPVADGPYREDEELIGDFPWTSGMVRLGSAEGYKLEGWPGPADADDGPDRHAIGFRMEFKDEKAIPQVLVEGDPGEALWLETSRNPGQLRDTRIRVKGRLFNVKSNRRASWKRLRVLEWETADAKYPADTDEAGPEPPADLPLFAETA